MLGGWEGDAGKNPARSSQPSEHLTTPRVWGLSSSKDDIQEQLGKGVPAKEKPAIFTSASRKGRVAFSAPSFRTYSQTQ